MPSTMTVASTAYITMSLLVVALNTAHARCGGDRRREWRRQAVRGSPEPGPGRCAPPGPGRGRSWCRYWRLVCRCGPAGQAGKRGCGVVYHEVRLEPGAYRPHEPVQFVRGHSGLSAVRALDHVGMHPQTAAVEELSSPRARQEDCGGPGRRGPSRGRLLRWKWLGAAYQPVRHGIDGCRESESDRCGRAGLADAGPGLGGFRLLHARVRDRATRPGGGVGHVDRGARPEPRFIPPPTA